jgi:hypothetical protein
VIRDDVVVAQTVAGPDARFSVLIDKLTSDDYEFEIYGEDTDGRKGTSLEYSLALSYGVSTEITGLYLAPTLAVGESEVERGDTVAIFGQTVPESVVTIGVASEHETFQYASADENGVFLYNFDTSALEIGEHHTRARGALASEVSPFGDNIAFSVREPEIIVDEGYVPCADCVPDIDGPYDFNTASSAPFIVILHGNDQAVYDGDYYLEFIETEDSVGIERYEVLELPKYFFQPQEQKWRYAESPYWLTDQRLTSIIYVRGYAKDGEVYVVVLDPSLGDVEKDRQWYQPPKTGLWSFFWHLPFDWLLILLLLYLYYRWRKYQKEKQKNKELQHHEYT